MSGLDDYIKERQAASAEQEPTVVDPAVTEPAPTAIEPTTTEPAPTEVTPHPGVDLDDDKLNSFFETTGKTKDDIKSVFTLGTKYSELEKEKGEISEKLEELQKANAELKKGLDPLNYFSSEQAYVAEQLRKKYPTMDPVAIQKAVASDLSKMADLDVLALLDVIKRPGASGGEIMAKKILADQYDIDLSESPDQWDDLTKAKLERAAYDARHELQTFQKEVELPSIKSEEELEQERAKFAEDLLTKWDKVLPELQNFTKITIPGREEGESFDFEVTQDFRDGLGEFLEAMIVNGELEPDKETVHLLMEQREKDFIYQNLGKILAAREADLRSSLMKKTDEELNNTAPPNTTTKPVEGGDVGGTEQHLSGQKGRVRRY